MSFFNNRGNGFKIRTLFESKVVKQRRKVRREIKRLAQLQEVLEKGVELSDDGGGGSRGR